MNAILNMTTVNPDAAEGDNSAKALTALKAELKKLGQAEALGASSRAEAGLRIVSAAFDGLLKEGDAEMVYSTYQAGLIDMGRKRPLAVSNATSEKVQVSKFRQLIKVAMLPAIDARDLMQKVGDHIKDCTAAGVKINAPFDAMLNAARMQLGQPQDALTQDQISSCVEKPEAATKDDLEKLIDTYKRVAKLSETVTAPSAEAALQAMRDWIVEKGGEVPALTKEEKERADFLKKAAAFGYAPVVTPAATGATTGATTEGDAAE